MKDQLAKNYYNWTVKDGDYNTNLESYENKEDKSRKRRNLTISIFLLLVSLISIAVFIF